MCVLTDSTSSTYQLKYVNELVNICNPEQREGSAFTRACCSNNEILRLRLRMTILAGNSQGIRISKLLLQKYGFIDRLVLEETDRGILIRKPDEDSRFSWEETFKAMAQEEEDWRDLEVTLMDRLANDDA